MKLLGLFIPIPAVVWAFQFPAELSHVTLLIMAGMPQKASLSVRPALHNSARKCQSGVLFFLSCLNYFPSSGPIYAS